MRSAGRLLGLTVGIVFVLAACGGDDSSPTTGAGGAPTTVPDTTTTTGQSVAPPELAGTSWNVTEYQLPDGGITDLWPGTEITVRFHEDGTVSGFSGCNEYGGTYEVDGSYDPFEPGVRDPNDGQTLQLGGLSVTERGCESPTGVMEQEIEYLSAFQSSERWLIARGELLLRTAEGSLLVQAEPAP